MNVASVGFCYKTSFASGASVHAEIDALNNLKKNFKNTKKNISLTVIRVCFRHDGSHYYANSKPCADCISKMQTIAHIKGYRIKNVFYSNETGDIVRTRLNCLLDDVSKYVSTYYRRLMD
jgi:deoxycytidylate deaminase